MNSEKNKKQKRCRNFKRSKMFEKFDTSVSSNARFPFQIEDFRSKMLTEKTKISVDESRIRDLEKLETFLRKQLREWELKYEALRRENLALVEEKCELEEAENDSRLTAQR